jgi:serine protease
MPRVSLKTVGAAAAIVLAACSDAPVQAPDSEATPTLAVAQSGPEQVMPGEVIVKVRAGTDAAALGRAHGLAFGYAGYRNAFAVLRGAAGSERALAARLRNDARVEYAEPNYLRQPTAIDPKLWAFFNPGGLNMKFTRGGSAGQPLGASYASFADADEDNVEAYAAGGDPVVVGDIDTGVELTHKEFTGRLIIGRDWYNNDNNPSDDNGHGTHTTGTIAGTNVGVAGVSGAAANVTVHVQKVCGRRGCPSAAIASAIRAAADVPGMVAMNLSIGGSTETQAEKSAIAYAVDTIGVLVIASAGNDNTGTVSCPACDPKAISVGATNWRDVRTSYSNWGPGLDIVAPGGNCYSNTTPEGCIFSAIWSGHSGAITTTVNGTTATYGWMQGTSMAAPQVTGTAAIVASVTGLRGAQLRARLESTADDKGAAGYDQTYGNGRLNSYRAVTGATLPAGQ